MVVSPYLKLCIHRSPELRESAWLRAETSRVYQVYKHFLQSFFRVSLISILLCINTSETIPSGIPELPIKAAVGIV